MRMLSLLLFIPSVDRYLLNTRHWSKFYRYDVKQVRLDLWLALTQFIFYLIETDENK